MTLAGKNAVVTGAGSGFGAGIAKSFAEAGARVVICDIDGDAGERVAAEIGPAARFIACDVSVDREVAALARDATSFFGTPDIMVNNAGIAQTAGPMLDTSEEAFERIFAVNVKSIYLAARHFLPLFRENGGGVFLNTASSAALRPRPGLAWYNASKGAVVTLTKSMAVELAPERIRVNALCPVAGDTPLLAAFMGGTITDEMKERFLATIPMGRFSTGRDMGAAALYLCSDAADFITGVALEVDGGRCI